MSMNKNKADQEENKRKYMKVNDSSKKKRPIKKVKESVSQ